MVDFTKAGVQSTNLSSTSWLKEIVSSGADAQSNLFEIEFTNPGLNDACTNIFKTRVSNFIAPSIEVVTVSIPYQNVLVQKILPSSQLPKTIYFDFRLDQNYLLYQGLKKTLVIDENGGDRRDPYSQDSSYVSNDWTITVKSLKSAYYKDSFCETQAWKFNNCHLIKLDSITYGYSQSSPLNIKATFIYKNIESSNGDYTYDKIYASSGNLEEA